MTFAISINFSVGNTVVVDYVEADMELFKTLSSRAKTLANIDYARYKELTALKKALTFADNKISTSVLSAIGYNDTFDNFVDSIKTSNPELDHLISEYLVLANNSSDTDFLLKKKALLSEVSKEVNNSKVSNITVAVPRSYKNGEGVYETDFINCTLWNSVAEHTAEYVKKGDVVGIKGQLQTETYEDKEGNKKYITKVNVEKVSFLSSKKSEEVSE